MKYLSLYKTQLEHDDDNSRLIPNISLITDEQRLILTNENNIGTIFEHVDIIESFDDIINRFPTGNSTSMPGLKIYGDNTDQSKAKNIKIYNDAQRWRKDYLLHNGLSDTGQEIRINVDAVLIDNIIMDKYDNSYNYYINIYNDRFELMINDGLDIAIVYGDGWVKISFSSNGIFPSPTETRMPFLMFFSSMTGGSNSSLYNKAKEWRKKYILYNGLSDTGQPISMFVDRLYIDGYRMDEYDRYYHYHIDIYNDHIILLNERDSSEILTISRNGSVTILDIFNKFPYPTGTSSNMPGLKIYTNNTEQSKAENVKLYNAAQEWLNNLVDVDDSVDWAYMYVDALVIDDKTIDEYDDDCNYRIFIRRNDYISLNYNSLTIFGDGSVE